MVTGEDDAFLTNIPLNEEVKSFVFEMNGEGVLGTDGCSGFSSSMAKDYESGEEVMSSNYKLSISFDELQDVFNET